MICQSSEFGKAIWPLFAEPVTFINYAVHMSKAFICVVYFSKLTSHVVMVQVNNKSLLLVFNRWTSSPTGHSGGNVLPTHNSICTSFIKNICVGSVVYTCITEPPMIFILHLEHSSYIIDMQPLAYNCYC